MDEQLNRDMDAFRQINVAHLGSILNTKCPTRLAHPFLMQVGHHTWVLNRRGTELVATLQLAGLFSRDQWSLEDLQRVGSIMREMGADAYRAQRAT